MPHTETQRKAAFAELSRRKGGGGRRLYRDMGDEDLGEYARAPLKKRGRSSASSQAMALRGKG